MEVAISNSKAKFILGMKKKILKPFQYVLDENNGEPQHGCVIVPMMGYSRMQDFYLCVPKHGFYTRSANCQRYGEFMRLYFIDGNFIGAGRADKVNYVRRLYDAGKVYEAKQYALGYMLWRETSLGGNHINKRKEAARISHALCDERGKAGHEARQFIRKQILNR